jgi:hypothetical protein
MSYLKLPLFTCLNGRTLHLTNRQQNYIFSETIYLGEILLPVTGFHHPGFALKGPIKRGKDKANNPDSSVSSKQRHIIYEM